jgi:hypothetical protein
VSGVAERESEDGLHRSAASAGEPTTSLSCARIRISNSPERDDARIQLHIPAARIAPELCWKLVPRKQRARGMPDAQCTRSLVRAGGSKYAHEYSQRRHRITSGIPHAMVLTAYFALPGDRAFLPPSSLRSLLLRDLTPASGCQDHTTSPSAHNVIRLLTLLRPPHPAPRS